MRKHLFRTLQNRNTMFTLTAPELILILIALAILLIWGPSKIPGLARAIGQAIHEFKRGARGEAAEETSSGKLSKDEIYELARKLGINTEGKDLSQILDEINRKLSELRESQKI